MFDPTVAEGVCQVRQPGARWLSTGWDGGFERADAAYNVSVPEGWNRTDLDAYLAERRDRAGFERAGASLLTGVEMRHARGARLDGAVAYATVGLSNPAALPTEPAADGGESFDDGPAIDDQRGVDDATEDAHTASTLDDRASDDARPAGTVNVVVGTTRSLDDGTLASLLGVVVEAKAATLVAEAGFPGTTTDAVVVGCDPDGARATFAGSATAVGAAARACVREAVRASLRSRYADRERPRSVDDAEHGVVTDRRAEVFAP
jgi:adenosylcobinamide hydrolase